jgi:hypothetical protein
MKIVKNILFVGAIMMASQVQAVNEAEANYHTSKFNLFMNSDVSHGGPYGCWRHNNNDGDDVCFGSNPEHNPGLAHNPWVVPPVHPVY